MFWVSLSALQSLRSNSSFNDGNDNRIDGNRYITNKNSMKNEFEKKKEKAKFGMNGDTCRLSESGRSRLVPRTHGPVHESALR
jgi:hypothetical protein